jgi:uncharacterized protein (TIGR02118 family)
MYRVLVLYLPPKDLQASREYFEDTHIPLAAKLPDQRTMRYSFEVVAAERESPYFGVMETEFDDAEALGTALASGSGGRHSQLRHGRRRHPELPRSRSAIAIASISAASHSLSPSSCRCRGATKSSRASTQDTAEAQYGHCGDQHQK